MKRYTVYISGIYWGGSSDSVQFVKRVNSTSRINALLKCLPEIISVISSLPDNYKKISVNVGLTFSITSRASRLDAIQIDRSGKLVNPQFYIK